MRSKLLGFICGGQAAIASTEVVVLCVDSFDLGKLLVSDLLRLVSKNDCKVRTMNLCDQFDKEQGRNYV